MKLKLRRTARFALILCLMLVLMGSTESRAFSDVRLGSWYEPVVSQMAARGIVNGCEDGLFHPERTITAAEFVTIVVRQSGIDQQPGQVRHWAAGYMEAARLAGWYDWDELPPTGERFDLPIPRQLAVKILMKAVLPDVTGDYATQAHKLSDLNELDGRYYDPVFAAYAAGVINGDEQGRFCPKRGLSRAEACAILIRAEGGAVNVPTATATPAPVQTAAPLTGTAVRGGVSENGWLQVIGTQLCNERGEPVLLRGMSSHGPQWFPEFLGEQAIRNTADWGANLFRIAMYTAEGGYLSQPETMKERVIAAADAAIALDMYVIIDWHILSDGNPTAHTEEAVSFFTELAQRYGENPAVLFELCNEPNGNVSWANDVKPYAERVISAIREYAPRTVLLIGSPTWSQDIHLAAADPIEGENLMYTLHFYAGTHGEWLRERVNNALAAGLPIFVTEWGTSRADGNGGVYLDESAAWLDYLEGKGISWANWSLASKDESSAALLPGTPANRPWTDSDLSASGKFVANRLGS